MGELEPISAGSQIGRAVSDIVIVQAGPEAAAEVHRLTQLAFGVYTWLTPPTGATKETEDDVRRDLAAHGGAVARLNGVGVGALRFVVEPHHLHVRRVAVDPAYQGRGIGRRLMEWVHAHAAGRGFAEVRLGVRSQLPGNRIFYEKLGYRTLREHRFPGSREVHWYEMVRPVGRRGAGSAPGAGQDRADGANRPG